MAGCKSRLDELAVFGGRPIFAEPLHVGRPSLGAPEMFLDRVRASLGRRWMTNDGPLVRELETKLADYLGVRHCLAVCNGTVALQLVAKALGLSGDVLVPAFTFIATAHAFEWLGIRPVFCDIDPKTHNVNPCSVERMITPRTTAIVGVHLWGRPCAIEALEVVARRHRLELLFDAAHAFGCSHRGMRIGRFGGAEVFSFHATKFFTTGEGGAVSTDDDELAARLRRMRNFGFAGYDEVVEVGTNAKMGELAAAVGLSSFETLPETVEANLRSYRDYQRGLRDLPGITLLSYDEREENNYQYIVAQIDEAEAGLSRDDLQQVLWAENVLARRYFWPGCHRMEPYSSRDPELRSHLPATEEVAGRVLCLPGGPGVERGQIATVCDIVRSVAERATEVRRRLSASRAPSAA